MGSFAKRTIDDQTLEELLLAKMEFVFKLLGPLAPKPVKDAIRKIVNERKTEIVQIVKQGGGALIKLLIQIWRNALLGGLWLKAFNCHLTLHKGKQCLYYHINI